MKNIIFICLTLLVITSCNEKDDFDVYKYNGPSTTYFVDGSASTYFVSQTSGPFQIRIGSTNLSESDRAYSLQIDPTSHASEGVDFSLTSNSVTIPSGEYFGTVSVQGIFDGTTPAGSTLILKLTGEDAYGIAINILSIWCKHAH